MKLSANEENTQYTIGLTEEIFEGDPDIKYQSICYIKDTRQIYTHGQLYNCDKCYTGIPVDNEIVIFDGNSGQIKSSGYTIEQLKNNLENGIENLKYFPITIDSNNKLSNNLIGQDIADAYNDGNIIIVNDYVATKVFISNNSVTLEYTTNSLWNNSDNSDGGRITIHRYVFSLNSNTASNYLTTKIDNEIATTSRKGLMSASDKTKLDSLEIPEISLITVDGFRDKITAEELSLLQKSDVCKINTTLPFRYEYYTKLNDYSEIVFSRLENKYNNEVFYKRIAFSITADGADVIIYDDLKVAELNETYTFKINEGDIVNADEFNKLRTALTENKHIIVDSSIYGTNLVKQISVEESIISLTYNVFYEQEESITTFSTITHYVPNGDIINTDLSSVNIVTKGNGSKFLSNDGTYKSAVTYVTNSSPNLDFGQTYTIGTIGDTDLTITMPENPIIVLPLSKYSLNPNKDNTQVSTKVEIDEEVFNKLFNNPNNYVVHSDSGWRFDTITTTISREGNYKYTIVRLKNQEYYLETQLTENTNDGTSSLSSTLTKYYIPQYLTQDDCIVNITDYEETSNPGQYKVIDIDSIHISDLYNGYNNGKSIKIHINNLFDGLVYKATTNAHGTYAPSLYANIIEYKNSQTILKEVELYYDFEFNQTYYFNLNETEISNNFILNFDTLSIADDARVLTQDLYDNLNQAYHEGKNITFVYQSTAYHIIQRSGDHWYALESVETGYYIDFCIKSDLTISYTDKRIFGNATSTSDGLMSADDKVKLDNLENSYAKKSEIVTYENATDQNNGLMPAYAHQIVSNLNSITTEAGLYKIEQNINDEGIFDVINYLHSGIYYAQNCIDNSKQIVYIISNDAIDNGISIDEFNKILEVLNSGGIILKKEGTLITVYRSYTLNNNSIELNYSLLFDNMYIIGTDLFEYDENEIIYKFNNTSTTHYISDTPYELEYNGDINISKIEASTIRNAVETVQIKLNIDGAYLYSTSQETVRKDGWYETFIYFMRGKTIYTVLVFDNDDDGDASISLTTETL